MKRFPQRAKAPQRQQVGATISRVAPVGGWNTRDPIAQMAPKYAPVLENFFPTAAGVSLRKGALDWVVGLTGNVKTLLSWQGQGSSKLFGISDSKIFNATASATNPASLLSRTKGEHIWTSFTGTGGTYLFAVNGIDPMAMFDGTNWTTVASFPITGGGTLNTSNIAVVGVFKRMLFFIQNDDTAFYFLPIDQISGTVSKFPLGGQIQRGGYLMAIGSWTVDAGGGQDDFCVFVTTRGEMIVYQGTDPSTAANWSLRGKYYIGPPLGMNCLLRTRNDLYMICESGLFSLNTALASTTASLQPDFTNAIGPTFRDYAGLTGQTYGWQVIAYEIQRMLIVNVPQQAAGTFNQFVMNLDTGAWCKFSNWNAYNFAILDQTLYFAAAGKVCKAWQDGGDYGSAITALASQAYDYLQPRATQKQLKLFRPVYTISGNGTAWTGLDADFQSTNIYENPSFSVDGSAKWDSAVWDSGVFAGLPSTNLNWQTASVDEGFAFSVRLRFIGQDATFQWVSTDYLFEAGSPV